jgi:hypothetical protein
MPLMNHLPIIHDSTWAGGETRTVLLLVLVGINAGDEKSGEENGKGESSAVRVGGGRGGRGGGKEGDEVLFEKVDGTMISIGL